jgi:hypothetical protein
MERYRFEPGKWWLIRLPHNHSELMIRLGGGDRYPRGAIYIRLLGQLPFPLSLPQ